MQIDFNLDQDFTSSLKFELTNIQTDRDKKLVVALVTMVSGDYALDPEIELSTIDEILDSVKTQNKESFTFQINEDGIEVDIG